MRTEFPLWTSHDGDVKPSMGNVSILQVKISYPITSHDFNVQISTVVPSQIATGYFWLLVSVSASMKTCIYQETQTQKLEQTFFLSFCPSVGEWKEWDLLHFCIACFLKDPARKPLAMRSWQRKGLLWSVKRLHLDPASVPETACCAIQKCLCANSPITHFLCPLCKFSLAGKLPELPAE